MPFAACQTQTLNKNNKDTHYKNKHPHSPHPPTPTTHPPTNSQQMKQQDLGAPVRAMLASTIQKSNNKKPTSLDPGIHPDRVLMSQNPNSVLENPPPAMRATLPRTRPQPTTPKESDQPQPAAVLSNPHHQAQAIHRRLHYPNTTMPTGRTPAVRVNAP